MPRMPLRRAVELGAVEYTGSDKTIDAPAVYGIGGSLLYFVDTYGDKGSPYSAKISTGSTPSTRLRKGVGFHYIDHLTHNVQRGNMDTWYRFYAETFNFREIRFFNIEGKVTGLHSRALTSPCGKIRIPINESADDKSQIEEYLKAIQRRGNPAYRGRRARYLYGDRCDRRAWPRIHAGPAGYLLCAVDGPREGSRRADRAHEAATVYLIDGEGVVDGGSTRILLQVFSKTVIGPIFFEFIQRKGDDGFGEGNFKALFESIEADQIERGVLAEAE